jgi:putative restriction endonuclease
MHERIARIRTRIRYDESAGSSDIGCIQLVSPTFFPPDLWIPQPKDWHPRTQTPVKYDLSGGEGKRVWDSCLAQAISLADVAPVAEFPSAQEQPRYAPARLIKPRLGQNTFRIAVLEAYNRGCAVTGEHSLPALEASHIRPYAQNGPHEIRNGLLLRADLHRLFDTGYITLTPELRLEVSSRLREDYHNGRSYYPLQGTQMQIPVDSSNWPAREFVEWHNERLFRG